MNNNVFQYGVPVPLVWQSLELNGHDGYTERKCSINIHYDNGNFYDSSSSFF